MFWATEIDIFYNRYWKPILRYLSDWRLVGFNWKNYFFIDSDVIYTYSWQQIWWIEWGIIRDLEGHVLAFWENPTDTPRPFLPFKQFKPFPAFLQFEPFRPFLPFKQFKPIKSFYWSKYRLTEEDNEK